MGRQARPEHPIGPLLAWRIAGRSGRLYVKRRIASVHGTVPAVRARQNLALAHARTGHVRLMLHRPRSPLVQHEGPLDPRHRKAPPRLAMAATPPGASTGNGMPAPAEVEALYRTETAHVVRGRLDLTVLLLLMFVGVSVFLEQRARPERLWPVTLTYLLEAVVAIAAVAACHVPRFAPHSVAIAAGMASVLGLMNGAYILLLGGDIDSLAMAQVCLMTGLAVMLPWGWRAQVVVCAFALGGFFLAATGAPAPGPQPWAVLGVWVGAVTSCIGVVALSRYRRSAFVRATLLTHLSALQREEAEISAALAHVSRELSQRVGQAGLLAAVNRLAVEILGCDWSTTLVPDEDGRCFRFVADHGSSAGGSRRARQRGPAAREPAAVRALPAGRAGRARRQRADPAAGGAAAALGDGVGAVDPGPPRRRDRGGDRRRTAHALGAVRREAAPARGRHRRRGRDRARERASDRRPAGRQPAQVRLRHDHVARAAHAAERDPRLRRDARRPGSHRQPAASRCRWCGASAAARINLLELVDATLDLARLEAGRDVVQEEPVDLDELCAELAGELEVPRAKSRSAWSGATTPAERSSSATARKLKTILKNLVDNALKYTREGTVEVELGLEGGHLAIEVRDDGAGIARENLPAIFEMFRQLESASTHPFGGVGLGLYIVKQLAERLGGSVRVESTLGVGSTFGVLIPARAAGPAVAARTSIAS